MHGAMVKVPRNVGRSLLKPASSQGEKTGKNTKATRDAKAQKINPNGNAKKDKNSKTIMHKRTKSKNYNTQKLDLGELGLN